MKLSKIIRLKSQKAIKLSPLHFHLSMPTRKFEEEKDSIEIVFSHMKVVFSPPKSVKKDLNMTIFGYSCGLQSSLYTKNHRFTFVQNRLLCLFSNPYIYRKFILWRAPARGLPPHNTTSTSQLRGDESADRPYS
jgi:hypothetical protein